MARQTQKKKQTRRTATKKAQDQGTTAFHSFLVFFRYNALGNFILAVVGLVLVVLFNCLIAGNQLESFALITGVELVLGMIIGWTVFLLKRNAKTDVESTGNSEE